MKEMNDTPSDRIKLAELIFSNNQLTIEEIYAHFPERDLLNSALVTRIAPSPTGFMHIGTLYVALISEMLAHQTGGVFFLRIEDTDKKREVEGATNLIVNTLNNYNIGIDEGEIKPSEEVGSYGPYTQSRRKEIYKAFARELIINGLAYPCFATHEELESMIAEQKSRHVTPGYYGDWAIWRDKPIKEALDMIEAGIPYVIRLRSDADPNVSIHVHDVLKGDLKLPQNEQDIVLLKSDGIPTYHFAHIIDDHLMGTTHVIRGDEWLSSLTLHLQLFEIMGWNPPTYGHLAPIQKTEDSSRRKLSKRKDPEASMQYYQQEGYPIEGVKSYLLNLANSSYEGWRKENIHEPIETYQLKVEELQGGAGALLDMVKLNDISKEEIAAMSADTVYKNALEWAQKYNPAFADILTQYRDYAISIFGIERGGPTARKDISKWSDIPKVFGYFFDELFTQVKVDISLLSDLPISDIDLIAQLTVDNYDINASKDTWLETMRNVAEQHGYAPNMKAYKASSNSFKGHFGTFTKVIRVLLTGGNQSPDLYELMRVMGKERVADRLLAHKKEQ